MANDCLVETLKGSVLNDSLSRLGTLRIHINSNENPALIRFYCSKSLSVDVYGNGGFSYFTESPDRTQTHKDVVANAQIDIYPKKNVEFDIYLSDKYAVTSLELLGDSHSNTLNINELQYSYGLTILRSQGSSSYKSTGFIDSFAELTALTNISIYLNDITGSIESLGKLTSLTTLNLATTLVSGSINTLANSMVSNGRTSGSLPILCNGIITYNGSVVPDVGSKVVKFGTSMENPTEEETSQGWQVV